MYAFPLELPEKCFSDACFYRREMATVKYKRRKAAMEGK